LSSSSSPHRARAKLAVVALAPARPAAPAAGAIDILAWGGPSVRRLALGAALLLAVGAGAREARAQDAARSAPGEVVVVPSSCGGGPWSSAAWVELLRVELAGDRIEVRPADSSPLASPAPRVGVEATPCDGAATSALLVYSDGPARRTKTIDLAGIDPVARARALAIAIADLVRSSIVAPSAGSPPAPPAPPAPAQVDVRVRIDDRRPPAQPPPDPPPGAEWFASAETRVFAQAPAGLFGARAGVQVPLAPWLAWTGDAGVLASSARDPLGEIDGTVATLGTALLGTGGDSGVLFGVGPRIEAGLGWFSGHATAPGVTASRSTTPLVFLAMTAVASFPIRGSFSGYLALDAGTSLHGFSAQADDRHVTDLVGPVLSARIGLALGSSARVAREARAP